MADEVVSPSLLALAVDVNQTVSGNPQFDLGMGEWLDSENWRKRRMKHHRRSICVLNLLRGNPLSVDLKTLCLPSSYRNFLRDSNVLVKKSNVPSPEVLKPSPALPAPNQGNTSTGLSPLFGSVQHCSISLQSSKHWACIYAECRH
jgi:hypothetical protein